MKSPMMSIAFFGNRSLANCEKNFQFAGSCVSGIWAPQRDVVLPRPGEGVHHVLGFLREDDGQRIVGKELVPAESRIRVRRVTGADDMAGQRRGRASRVPARMARGHASRTARVRTTRRVCGREARNGDRADSGGGRRPEQVTTRKFAHVRILSIGLRGTRLPRKRLPAGPAFVVAPAR